MNRKKFVLVVEKCILSKHHKQDLHQSLACQATGECGTVFGYVRDITFRISWFECENIQTVITLRIT
jgi:hypothetical protein